MALKWSQNYEKYLYDGGIYIVSYVILWFSGKLKCDIQAPVTSPISVEKGCGCALEGSVSR